MIRFETKKYNKKRRYLIVVFILLGFTNPLFSQSINETNILEKDPDSYNKQKAYNGNWYGDQTYFGYEYDMHANMNDTDLGDSIDVDNMVKAFMLSKCDLLQTDSKGHEGFVSWNSKTPTASITPGFKNEMVDIWVKAGNKLNIPCQAHYSGIWDGAAGKKFPSWNAVDKDGDPIEGKMCPRGPYVDQLLIPQAKELIGKYGVSAMWVDGEIWAVKQCYCDNCKAAFKRRTNLEAPTSEEDENWIKWIDFTRESFQEYVAHYADEIHEAFPEARVCSNWLHSFRNPGTPWVPTDYISGDNLGTNAHPNNFCNARFMSTRQRAWEIVLWGFFYNEKSPWIMKSVDMMKQQAATIIGMGGNINIYNQPKGHRNGLLPDWQMKRIGQVSDFLKARKPFCQNTKTLSNAVILHSEHDFYAQKSSGIYEHETEHLEGALFSMIDNSIAADIMDEWALLDKIDEFPLVIAPSQEKMSKEAVQKLKKYVKNGGHLLVTGVDIYETFGADFLGVNNVSNNAQHTYHIPAKDGRVPLSSLGHQGGAWTDVKVFPWREVLPTTAKGIAPLTTSLLENEKSSYHGATINKVGKGKVAYIPTDIMTYYYNSRYALVREFINDVVTELNPDFKIKVDAPSCVEVILRQKEGEKIINLVNRASGLPVFENTLGSDEIPQVGPITISVKVNSKPTRVENHFEEGKLEWKYNKDSKTVEMTMDRFHINEIITIE